MTIILYLVLASGEYIGLERFDSMKECNLFKTEVENLYYEKHGEIPKLECKERNK